METMTVEQAVTKLKLLNMESNERAHREADKVLLAMVPEEVRKAYDALDDSFNGFWYE